MVATEYMWRDVVLGLGRPRVGAPNLGLRPSNWRRNTLTDSGCQLVSKIPVDSRRILAWDRCHWKLYEIVLPTSFRTSKTDSVCDLGVRFIAHCSWTPNWARTWIAFGLHLWDSNRISLVPPLRLGHPFWTSSTPFHAPIMVVCMGAMSSSFSPSWREAILGVNCTWNRSCTTKRRTGLQEQRKPKVLRGEMSPCFFHSHVGFLIGYSDDTRCLATLSCTRLVPTKEEAGIGSNQQGSPSWELTCCLSLQQRGLIFIV
jgi:hypothetical protein